MGLLSRFVNVVRAQLNALLNRAEDPAKMLDQTLVDMRASFGKAKDEVAHAIADQSRLEKALQQEQDEVARWEEKAVLAVEKGDDDLAREALRRKNEHTRFAAQYQHELGAQADNVARLKESLRDLEQKIGELGRKKNLLATRQKRAEAQERINRTLDGLDTEGALDTVRRMEEKIEHMGAVADARHQLRGEFSGDDLERRFQNLEATGDDVDNELLALKQRVQIEHKESE